MQKLQTDRERKIAFGLAEWREFEAPIAWRISAKGNRWRTWAEKTVTIFRRHDGFSWCIHDESEGARYSSRTFDNEADARTDLGEALEVGLC